MSYANKLARTTLVAALASGCAVFSSLPAHAGFLGGAGGAVVGGAGLGGVVGGSGGAGSMVGGTMGMGGVAGGAAGSAGGQRRFEAGSAITGRGEAGVSQEIRAPGRRLIDATDNAAGQAAARGRNAIGQAQGRAEGAAAAGAQAAQGAQAAGAQAGQGAQAAGARATQDAQATQALQGGFQGVVTRNPLEQPRPGIAPAADGSTGAVGSAGAAAGSNGLATAAGQVDGQGAVRAERSDRSSGAGVSVQGSAQGSVGR